MRQAHDVEIIERVTELLHRYPSLAAIPRDDVICLALETLGMPGREAKDVMAQIQEQDDE